MTGLAKVRGSETEEYGHGTAKPALVLEEVGAVFGAHLGTSHIAATATNKFSRVERLAALLSVAACFTTVVGLLTLVAHVVGVTVHCISGWVLVVATT